MSVRVRFAIWVGLVAGLIVGTPAWFWLTSDGELPARDFWFVLGWLVLGAATVGVFALLASTPANAIKLRANVSIVLVLGAAAVLQGLAVAWVPPVVSEDLVRYRVDGRMVLEGRSPYLTTPLRWFAGGNGDSADALVRHPAVASVYPPVAQIWFSIAAWLENRLLPTTDVPEELNYAQWINQAPWWERFVVYRAGAAAAAVVATALLLWILRQFGASPWWAAVFGWNPLVLMECGGQGHVDVFGIVALLACIASLVRGWAATAGAMIVLAAGVKPQAILLLPLVVIAASGLRWRAFAGAGCTAVVMFCVMAPNSAWQAYIANVAVFSRAWEANGSIYEAVVRMAQWGDTIGDRTQIAKSWMRVVSLSLTLLALAMAIWHGLKRADVRTAVGGMYAVMLVLLLSGSVLYPWYLMWALAPAVLLVGRYGAAAIGWSATVAISYLLWRYEDWSLPAWLVAAQYVPVYVVAVMELVAWCRNWGDDLKTNGATRSLSG